jgi:hypothetical protein
MLAWLSLIADIIVLALLVILTFVSAADETSNMIKNDDTRFVLQLIFFITCMMTLGSVVCIIF